jgi:hypothetical protein
MQGYTRRLRPYLNSSVNHYLSHLWDSIPVATFQSLSFLFPYNLLTPTHNAITSPHQTTSTTRYDMSRCLSPTVNVLIYRSESYRLWVNNYYQGRCAVAYNSWWEGSRNAPVWYSICYSKWIVPSILFAFHSDQLYLSNRCNVFLIRLQSMV